MAPPDTPSTLKPIQGQGKGVATGSGIGSTLYPLLRVPYTHPKQTLSGSRYRGHGIDAIGVTV